MFKFAFWQLKQMLEIHNMCKIIKIFKCQTGFWWYDDHHMVLWWSFGITMIIIWWYNHHLVLWWSTCDQTKGRNGRRCSAWSFHSVFSCWWSLDHDRNRGDIMMMVVVMMVVVMVMMLVMFPGTILVERRVMGMIKNCWPWN